MSKALLLLLLLLLLAAMVYKPLPLAGKVGPKFMMARSVHQMS